MIKKGKTLPTLISSVLIGMSVPAYGDNALQELEKLRHRQCPKYC